MLEVVKRRYSRILGESSAIYDKPTSVDAYTWLLELRAHGKAPITVPDLVVVDGGKGQLAMAERVLAEIGLAKMPVGYVCCNVCAMRLTVLPIITTNFSCASGCARAASIPVRE